MVEVKRLVLDRTKLERRPALAAQDATRNRFEVALVGVFENDYAARPGNAAKLGQHRPGVGEVVEHPDANRGVEEAVGVGQGAGVAKYDFDALVACECLAGSRYVHLGRIEQDDLTVAVVLVGEPAESRSDLDQTIAR